jgi:murein L,D-transpeptidase YafK
LLSFLIILARAGIAVAADESLGPADRVVVEKAARTLTLYRDSTALKNYHVALGFAPEGAKERQGDGRTPEGLYVIDRRNPKSQFHLALHISYPNEEDRARAAAAGVDPGGDIFIHGLPNGFGHAGALFNLRDWTLGCIAVTNAEIEEIWAAVPDGTPIEIRP